MDDRTILQAEDVRVRVVTLGMDDVNEARFIYYVKMKELVRIFLQYTTTKDGGEEVAVLPMTASRFVIANTGKPL